MKMDSRVPGVPKDGALEAREANSLKLARLALREPANGQTIRTIAREADVAKIALSQNGTAVIRG
jgi:hypothetical protein